MSAEAKHRKTVPLNWAITDHGEIRERFFTYSEASRALTRGHYGDDPLVEYIADK